MLGYSAIQSVMCCILRKMATTSGTEKTLAKKLKNNMGKLLISTLLMSIAVILVTIIVTVEGRAKTPESTSDSSSITATTISSVQSQVSENTQKPATNVSWSHENLKTGNGSVIIDKGI